jgi:hypothetical protein
MIKKINFIQIQDLLLAIPLPPNFQQTFLLSLIITVLLLAGAQIPDLSTYDGVSNNILRIQVRAIDEKSMPSAGPLSACDLQKLQIWINNGAQNN